MAKKTIYSDILSGQVNTFGDGMNKDLHPMIQPGDTYTDCLNGTLITYNGNEHVMQNDMGNYELKNAKLPEGYIPLGMKEYQGILYIVSTNPETGKTQIGTYPSPRSIMYDNEELSREISPVELGEYGKLNSTIINSIFDGSNEEYLYSKLEAKNKAVVFSNNFDEDSQLNLRDKYELIGDADTEAPLQSLKFYSVGDDNSREDISDSVVVKTTESEDIDERVSWDKPGWLMAKYELDTIDKFEQHVSCTYSKPVPQIVNSIKKFEALFLKDKSGGKGDYYGTSITPVTSDG